MVNLLLAAGLRNRTPVPADLNEIRSTVTAVNEDAPSATEATTPEYNSFDADPDTEGGLTDHQLSAYKIPRTKYVPAIGNAGTDFVAPISEQIASSGTAAARELAGEWGHGTYEFSQSIEPPVSDGHPYGDDYFSADNRVRAVSAQLSAPGTRDDAAAQATAISNSRAAVSASQSGAGAADPYAAMYDALMSGGTIA